jgi:hypothetical protein
MNFFKFKVLLFLLFSINANAQSNKLTIVEKSFTFLIDKKLDEFEYISSVRSMAIQGVVASEVESVSKLESEDKNINGVIRSRQDFISSTEIQTLGIWVKDITPPEITYTNKGKEKWITVKVHGYVAKRPNKTEARELLLKQLSTKPLMEDVQVHLIEYYPNDFIVSAVVLDKRIHTNEANINTEARMIAESNLQEAVIIGNYRKAYGWVPSVEFLTTLKGTTDHHVVYIFIKEVEEE